MYSIIYYIVAGLDLYIKSVSLLFPATVSIHLTKDKQKMTFKQKHLMTTLDPLCFDTKVCSLTFDLRVPENYKTWGEPYKGR